MRPIPYAPRIIHAPPTVLRAEPIRDDWSRYEEPAFKRRPEYVAHSKWRWHPQAVAPRTS